MCRSPSCWGCRYSPPPFVSDDLVRELATSLFATLLPPECEYCGARYGCSRPFGLGAKGQEVRHDDPSAVVLWPACPWKWGALWRWGQEMLPPSEVCRWLVECGVHRHPRLSAGGHRLLREWSRLSDLPGRLMTARRIEKDRQAGNRWK